MASSNQLLQEGIAAFKEGDKAKAAQLLAQVVQVDETNEQAWYYLAASQTNPERRKHCLEMVLKINPNNAKAREMLDRVNERLSSQAPPAPKGEAVEPNLRVVKPEAVYSGAGFKIPVEIPGAPEKITPKELIDTGVSLLRNSVGIFMKEPAAYEDEIRRATWWRFWLTVGTGSVVGAIFVALGQLFLQLRYSGSIFTAIMTLIFSIPINMVAVYAGSYASHWYATKQAHGLASLLDHSHAMAAAWLPGNVLGAALGAVVALVFGTTASFALITGGGLAFFGLGIIIAIIVAIAVGLYTLSIQVKGVQILYKFVGGPLWITTAIFLIGTGLVYSILDSILPG